MKSYSRNNYLLIFATSFLVLISSFQFNIFGVMPGDSVYENTRDIFSEALVIGRIVRTHEDGYLSSSGLMGRYGEIDNENHWIFRQYDIFFSGNAPNFEFPFNAYTSNAGLQGIIYSLLDSIGITMGIDSSYKRLFIHKLINSSLLALILSLFVVVSFKTLGLGSSIVSTILIALSHWLIGFSVNLYWVIFLAISPFVITFIFLTKNPNPSNINKLCLLIFFVILLKSLTGYEYMSTILIAMVTPFVFFSIKEGWAVNILLKRLVWISTSAILGFIMAISLHIFQMTNYLNGITNAILALAQRVSARTYGEQGDLEMLRMGQENYNIAKIISRYFEGHAFYLNDLIGYSGIIRFWMIIIFLLVFSFIGHYIVRKYFYSLYRLNNAIITATWFSILAPLSWFFLAKGHSFVHTHLNHVLWYVPFLLLGFAYIGFVLELLFRKVESELHTH